MRIVKGVPDTSEVDDGFWFFFVFVIDVALMAISAGLTAVIVCVEIAAWVLSGGLDFLLRMIGFDDD